ncbi:hypothetical protein ACHWQZ_G001606 [Mnemiopsis leidyi]
MPASSYVIPSVREYCYLGTTFSISGSMKANQAQLRMKGLRAYFSLKSAIDLSSIDKAAILKLFDSLILPVISYGCQVWLPRTQLMKCLADNTKKAGKEILSAIAQDPMENLHLSLLKWTLGMRKRTANIPIWGDTGRCPIGMEMTKLLVDFLNRLVLLDTADSPQIVRHQPCIHRAIKPWTRLDELCYEPYLQLRDHKKAKTLAWLRTSSHRLNVETGRYGTRNTSIHRRIKESWELINDISGRTRTCCGLTEGSSPAERLNNWKKHFAGLLGQPPSVPDANITIRNIHPPLDIDINPFTPEELAQAKTQIVEGKAFGDDGISPEVMKRVDLDEIILKFCNDALTKGEIPDQWKLSNIIPVPKKGDLTKTDNYRGISLTSIVCKTLNRMVLNRIKPRLEEVLRDNQNGFRPGRSTTSHILALRRIIEGAKAKNLKATMVFIDFKKAFDSVHRGLLMKILRSYGIPDTIVRLIDNVYTGTVAKVLTAEGCTEVFDILAGVLQGDTLAPYLFIIVIDYIMTVAIDDNETEHGFTLKPAQSRRVVSETVTDVEFADDVALVTDSIEAAQNLLGRLETAASSVGLSMNDGKTEFLTVNTPDEEANIKSSSGRQLKHVKDFKYLGSWIATTEKDIRTRKAKAWAACHKLMKVWKSNLRRSMKIRLFVATVESILLYGSETWTLTESLSKQIDGCYTRMLRMALDVNWKQHLTNKEVYGTLPRATMKIQERRMRLAGHLQRHPELTASSLLLWEPKHGARTRGRPALTYVDNLRKDTGLSDTREIAGLMADRLLWRRHINARTLKPP